MNNLQMFPFDFSILINFAFDDWNNLQRLESINEDHLYFDNLLFKEINTFNDFRNLFQCFNLYGWRAQKKKRWMLKTHNL